jgi:hypothetical protein
MPKSKARGIQGCAQTLYPVCFSPISSPIAPSSHAPAGLEAGDFENAKCLDSRNSTTVKRLGTKMGTNCGFEGFEVGGRGGKSFVLWWAQQDSNLRPADDESVRMRPQKNSVDIEHVITFLHFSTSE